MSNHIYIVQKHLVPFITDSLKKGAASNFEWIGTPKISLRYH